MAVPYIFEYRTGNIPLSELDADFSYFTNSLTITGTNTAVIGNLSVGGTTTFTGGVTIPSVSISGNATFTGTGNRILGDFSNATVANRVMFQTSTTNGNTFVSALPNGTSTSSAFQARNSSDANNNSSFRLGAFSTDVRVESTITGTGTYLPITFYTNAVEQMRIDTSGYVGIGAASNGAKMVISQNSTIPAYNAGGITGATLQLGLTDSSGVTNRFVLDATNGGGCSITGRASGGTYASPTATVINQNLINFTSRGYTGTTWIGNGALNLFAESTFTTSSTPTAWQFNCGNTGTTGQTERMRLWSSGGLSLGNVVDPGTANLSVTGTITSVGNISGPVTATTLSASSTSTFTGLATFNGGVATTSLTASTTSTFTGLATFNSGLTVAAGQTTTLGGTVTMSTAGGNITMGSTAGTATITLGQSTVSQTTNIQAGVTSTGNTKTISFGTGGASGSTTSITMGSATAGSTTTSIIYGNLTYTPANVADVLTLGGTTQTGALTLGQSTVSQTTNIGAGITVSGSTKAINIGQNGAAGSTTSIAIGSLTSTTTIAIAGSLTTTGATVINNTTASNTTINSASTTGTLTIGAATQSGTIIVGQSTTGQTTSISAGAMVSGQTKTINIGTAGLSGSTTNIAIGSAVSGATSTTTVNGVLKSQVYTVATLPSAVTSGVGAKSFVSDASVVAGNFGNSVVGGGVLPCPVWSDGTNWKIG